MLGFVNGLAIVIFLAQMSQFQITDISGNKQWMEGQNLVVMLLLVIATMIVIWGMPKKECSPASSASAAFGGRHDFCRTLGTTIRETDAAWLGKVQSIRHA